MSVPAFLLLLFAPAVADTTAPDSLPHVDVGEILDLLQDESGVEDLLEALLWRQEHPFDLNRVSIAELLSLPFVTESDAEAVIRFRASGGGFRSPAQLRSMPGGGDRAFHVISPYVTVAPRELHRDAKHVLIFRSRFEERRPPDDGARGSPVHAYSRIGIAPVSGIEAGGLFERDAGELSRDAFRGGYLSARGIGSGVDVLIGDYSIESGQGLVLWGGSGMSRSGWSVTGPRKAPLGVTPHRSTDEIRFFRGIALSARLADGGERWDGILFVSRRFLPGGPGDPGEGSSISAAAAFTTASSAARKDAVRVDSRGARMLYSRGDLLSAGMTFVSSRYGIRIRREDPLRFSGERFDAGGLDVRLVTSPFMLFGEFARGGEGTALVTGAGIEAGERFSVLLVLRSYSPGYDNLHANGFGDNGDTRNEQGAYAGFSLQPVHWLSVHAYYDQFRRPGPGSLAGFPVSGTEVMVDAEAEITPRIDVAARITMRSAGIPVATTDERGRDVRVEGRRRQARWRLGTSVRFDRGCEVKARLELTDVSIRPGGRERGFLAGGEFEARPFSIARLTARLMFFATGSYESRLYSFESDFPGAFSSHPLYGGGRRWSVTFRLDLSGWCSLSAIVDATEREPSVPADPPHREIPPLRQSHAGFQIDVRL